ncbi:MAG: hypothetical protein RIC95_05715 [Vicingaceae bacterium]
MIRKPLLLSTVVSLFFLSCVKDSDDDLTVVVNSGPKSTKSSITTMPLIFPSNKTVRWYTDTTQQFKVTFGENDSLVSHVRFLVDSLEALVDSIAPYQFNYQINFAQVGDHEISTEVYSAQNSLIGDTSTNFTIVDYRNPFFGDYNFTVIKKPYGGNGYIEPFDTIHFQGNIKEYGSGLYNNTCGMGWASTPNNLILIQYLPQKEVYFKIFQNDSLASCSTFGYSEQRGGLIQADSISFLIGFGGRGGGIDELVTGSKIIL